MIPPPPRSTLFPYTTLFRSNHADPEEFLVGTRKDEFEHARRVAGEDRKSTRLNSSHVAISYAVFCLKKKTPSTKLSKSPTSAIPEFREPLCERCPGGMFLTR